MTSLPDRKLTSRPFHLPRGLRGVQAVAQDAASRSCKADRCQARWGWWDASVKTKHHLRKRTLFDCRRRRPGQEIDAVQRRRALGSPRACSLSSFAERPRLKEFISRTIVMLTRAVKATSNWLLTPVGL